MRLRVLKGIQSHLKRLDLLKSQYHNLLVHVHFTTCTAVHTCLIVGSTFWCFNHFWLKAGPGFVLENIPIKQTATNFCPCLFTTLASFAHIRAQTDLMFSKL